MKRTRNKALHWQHSWIFAIFSVDCLNKNGQFLSRVF